MKRKQNRTKCEFSVSEIGTTNNRIFVIVACQVIAALLTLHLTRFHRKLVTLRSHESFVEFYSIKKCCFQKF